MIILNPPRSCFPDRPLPTGAGFDVENLWFCRPLCSPSVAKGTTIIVSSVFGLIKFGQAFSNRWLVGKSPMGKTCFEQGATAPPLTQPKDTTMKKIILFAAMFGLAAALNVKADGAKDNWDSLCAKCHGPEGKGDTKMGTKLGCKDFTDATVQAGIKDDAAFKALKEGLKSDDDKTLMKPFGDQLSDDDIKALVAYVHTLKK